MSFENQQWRKAVSTLDIPSNYDTPTPALYPPSPTSTQRSWCTLTVHNNWWTAIICFLQACIQDGLVTYLDPCILIRQGPCSYASNRLSWIQMQAGIMPQPCSTNKVLRSNTKSNLNYTYSVDYVIINIITSLCWKTEIPYVDITR